MIHRLFEYISDSAKRRMRSLPSKKAPDNEGGREDAPVIYHLQDSPLSTEIDLSFMRPVKREKVLEKFDRFHYREDLGVVSCDDAIILPGIEHKGGVIDSSGLFVKESASLWFGGAYDIADDRTIDHDERTVVFLGEYATATWGHIFLSPMTRFWYCLSQKENVDAYVIISECPGQKNNNKPLNDLLRLAGLDNKILYLDRPTHFKKVIVPECSLTIDWYSAQYLKTIDTIRQNALKEPHNSEAAPKKIFLSRSHFSRAKKAEGGLEFLDHYFKRNGFTILYPEEIPLAQMIRIMQNAAVCASESGSITYNTLFGNTNLHVIVIDRIPMFADCCLTTNLSRAKRITYVDGSYVLYPGNVGGACMIGFTDEFERFTLHNRYHRPSSSYLNTKYKKKCLELYQRHYKNMNTYEQWLNSSKHDWLPAVYEAFSESIKQFPWLDKEAILDEYYRDMFN